MTQQHCWVSPLLYLLYLLVERSHTSRSAGPGSCFPKDSLGSCSLSWFINGSLLHCHKFPSGKNMVLLLILSLKKKKKKFSTPIKRTSAIQHNMPSTALCGGRWEKMPPRNGRVNFLSADLCSSFKTLCTWKHSRWLGKHGHCLTSLPDMPLWPHVNGVPNVVAAQSSGWYSDLWTQCFIAGCYGNTTFIKLFCIFLSLNKCRYGMILICCIWAGGGDIHLKCTCTESGLL